jgi:hypothetical protein
MTSDRISWAVHVDYKGNSMCEFRYDDQVMLLPLEHVKDFSTKLNEWIDAVLLESNSNDLST